MAFWEALPDAQIVADNLFVAGETVGRGNPYRYPYGYLPGPAGGRAGQRQPPVRLRYASVKQIRDGKVAREHLYFDQLEFLQQIGALPAGL